MFPSLRFRLFLAFVLMAGILASVTLLAVSSQRQAAEAVAGLLSRQEGVRSALSDLGALGLEGEVILRSHLAAKGSAARATLAADLLGVEARETLALARLAAAAGPDGPARAAVAEAEAAVDLVAALRLRIMDLTSGATLEEAALLATQEMPALRAELVEALRDLGGAAATGVPALRAEAALNALAAAQKNAILAPEAGYVTSQLAIATFARADLATALTDLAAAGAGLAGLAPALDTLARLDARMGDLLTDPARDEAERLFLLDFPAAMTSARTALQGVEDLAGTILAAEVAAMKADQQDLQMKLILMADVALLIGALLTVLALRGIGHGLEGAVRLAEQMAASEEAPPTWVQSALAGRLTAALVRISAGQSAVVAAIERVIAGQPIRPNVPEPIRRKLEVLAARLDRAPQDDAGIEPARAGIAALHITLTQARDQGRGLVDAAEDLVGLARQGTPLSEPLLRQTLLAEQHFATLAQAESQILDAARHLGLQAAPGVLPVAPRRIA